MSPEKFNRLNQENRLLTLLCKGEFVSEIVYYGYRIKLYVIDSLFIEIFTNIHSSMIEQVEIMDPKEQRLNLYVADVDINVLFR